MSLVQGREVCIFLADATADLLLICGMRTLAQDRVECDELAKNVTRDLRCTANSSRT